MALLGREREALLFLPVSWAQPRPAAQVGGQCAGVSGKLEKLVPSKHGPRGTRKTKSGTSQPPLLSMDCQALNSFMVGVQETR